MIAKLTKELAAALNATGEGELEVVDLETRRRHDRDAIAEGLVQMEAGQGKPLDQAFSDMRSRLKFPQSQ